MAGSTHTAHSCVNLGVQLIQVLSATVSQFLSFDISPQGLHRVQVRRVARQPFHDQPTPLTAQIVPHDPALVRRQAIPNQGGFLAAQFALEIFQKGYQTDGIVVSVPDLKPEAAAASIRAITEGRADG